MSYNVFQVADSKLQVSLTAIFNAVTKIIAFKNLYLYFFRPLRLEIVYRGAFRIRSFLQTIKTKKTVLISGEGTVNYRQ